MKAETAVPPATRRGPKGYDYSILDRAPAISISGDDLTEVRVRTSNIRAGAIKKGYRVRSQVIKRGEEYVGYVIKY